MKNTIQIIDDNVALTTLLAKTLSKFGYDTVVENNPLLAINSARHHLPDLILLDVMMPERDGGRVLADLRADFSLRYIPVILLTAIAREAQALSGTGGIESVILAKPVQLTELVKTIEEQLTGSPSHELEIAPLPSAGAAKLPNFDSMRPDGLTSSAPLELPGASEGSFDNPGPRADSTFSPTLNNDQAAAQSGPDFSFPERSGDDAPKSNPW